MKSEDSAGAPAPRRTMIALAGNPNAGKTTIFNMLTGTRQHMGNYPGVTVERKEGEVRQGDRRVDVIDLPGAYSLSARSAEEIVARNVLIEERPDAVIAVVDASNLERNLYLAMQLLELGVPLVIALNMWDMLEEKGLTVDVERMSRLIGVPVVATTGHKGQGVREAFEIALQVADGQRTVRPFHIQYGNEIEPHVKKIQARIESLPALKSRARWFALKMLEGDAETGRRVKALCEDSADELKAYAEQHRKHIEQIFDEKIAALLADRRYGAIAGICAEAVTQTGIARISRSEQVDRVVLNRWLGLPIFGGLMYLAFYLTFSLGEPLTQWLAGGFSLLGRWVSAWWAPDSESLLRSLLVDGAIAGVGGVVAFLPTILLLFLAIAILEDSGYMARAAFIMDRFMHAIGLHGKSFIPMLLGFGCTVPAIMGTRTLESRRDRITTIMVLPLMSCGARIPIYVLFLQALFPKHWHAPVMWGLYALGILIAVLAAKLLRSTLLKGETVPFVMELPPYRLPTLRGMLIHMWERAGYFLRKAGTLILGASVVLWALSVWPALPADAEADFRAEQEQILADRATNENVRAEALQQLDYRHAQEALRHSLVGRVGRTLAPVLRPLGFDWRISTALIGAFAAKEVFVAQMGIVYSMGETDEESGSLQNRLREDYTKTQAMAIMIFCLISMPCMATVAITRREAGGWRWAALQLVGLTVLAWIVTAVFYQVARLLV
jgi:ferrous iron transport protein B